DFIVPLEIPFVPTTLQLGDFHCLSKVESWDLTVNLKIHLQMLYKTKSFKSNTLATTFHGVVPISVHSWIIDFGTIDHMTGCSKMFSYNLYAGDKKVKIANDSLSAIVKTCFAGPIGSSRPKPSRSKSSWPKPGTSRPGTSRPVQCSQSSRH
ncbi:hypothetical protein CR513_62970, partial [Mucuna pruriens]